MSLHYASSWLFWALLSALFAALTAVFAKLGVETVDSDLATFLRTVIIVLVLGLALMVSGKFTSIASIGPRAWVFLAASGLATGASWYCYFHALKVGDAVRVAPVDKVSVVLVAVIGALLLGEHLSARGWIGIFLIAVGAALVAVA